MLDVEVIVGGRDEHASGVERLLVLGLAHRQRAARVEQLRETAAVGVGLAVLGDDDGRAEVRAAAPPSTRSTACSPPHDAPIATSSTRHHMRRRKIFSASSSGSYSAAWRERRIDSLRPRARMPKRVMLSPKSCRTSSCNAGPK